MRIKLLKARCPSFAEYFFHTLARWKSARSK